MATEPGTEFADQLERLREHAGRRAVEIAQQFSTYTKHDLGHFNEVARIAKFVSGPIDLSPEERFVLEAASYCHDLGMAHTPAQDIYDLNDREAVRRWHARLSREYVLSEAFPYDCIRDEGLRDAVGRISEGHGRWDWHDSFFDDAYGLRIRLLTALLSLADVLDLRSDRRNPTTFKDQAALLKYSFLGDANAPEKYRDVSRVHWLRHYYAQKPSLHFVDSRRLEIGLKGQVGRQSGTPDRLEPDDREALIKEMIQSEVVELVENDLFRQYLAPYYTITLRRVDGTWPSYVETQSVADKMLFPNELVEAAFAAGLVKKRTLELKDKEAYYRVRIEPFIGPRDVQVSVSWLPWIARTDESINTDTLKTAEQRLAKVAAQNWDFVLWPLTPFVERLLSELTPTDSTQVRNRFSQIRQKTETIRTGNFRKYYIGVDGAPEPLTATSHVAKYGAYNGFPSQDNFLGGSVELVTKDQRASFLTNCQLVARELGIQTSAADVASRLSLVADTRTAYDVTLCTAARIAETLRTEIRGRQVDPTLDRFLEEFIAELHATSASAFDRVKALRGRTVALRDMTAAHVADILNVEKESSEYPWTDQAAFDKHIADKSAQVLMLADTPIGYLLTAKQPDGELLLVKMAVHPAYRRRGFAQMMLRDVERLARQDPGFRSIILHVRESNTAAVALYKRFGYRVYEELDDYYKRTGATPSEKKALAMRFRLSA